MNKVNKVTAFVLLILVATTISTTLSLVNAVTANTKLRNAVTANTKLRNEVKAYKAYYNASESLFEEIDDYNDNLFDTDKAVDYYKAKKNFPFK